MLKLIACLVFVALWVGSAGAEPYSLTLSLGEAGSGSTTVASGTSTMWVRASKTWMVGVDGQTLQNLRQTDGKLVIQLDKIALTGVSPANSLQKSSGATITLTYKESLVDGVTAWAAAEEVAILGPVALSGTTLRQVAVYPEAMAHMRFYFKSGITRFLEATFKGEGI